MAKTLKELREEKGLTIDELAKASGVKPIKIERMEKLELDNVKVNDLYLVSKYLGTLQIQDLTVFD